MTVTGREIPARKGREQCILTGKGFRRLEDGRTYISDLDGIVSLREIYGGTVTMKLSEIPSDRPGYAMYQTIIEDTGIGMSEEFLPHLFEEFTRERSSTESKLNGTGLGMPIVKKLIDLMQGTIEVQSEIGKGTKITETLPHRIAQNTNTRQLLEETHDYDANRFKGKRILLAEDNELNAEIAITILQEAGFEVEHAEDGVICVDMLEKADDDYYDLILMDIQMPNMDGYKAGMNWHIAKPIIVDELMSALAELLKE